MNNKELNEDARTKQDLLFECSSLESKLSDEIIKNAELKQENKRLNGTIQTYDILLKSNVEENQQLKYNWNKLKEYLEKNWTESQDIWFVKIINKMREIEGSDSNVKD